LPTLAYTYVQQTERSRQPGLQRSAIPVLCGPYHHI
jgi:hypothetical protein